MTRGFVIAKDRGHRISHRVYGIGEKSAMGDGRGDSARVLRPSPPAPNAWSPSTWPRRPRAPAA
ncbi:MAG: hypothetical protein WDM92_08175 [Caulobacteraceae bacterium]